MKKKILAMSLACIMAFGFVGCSNDTPPAENSTKNEESNADTKKEPQKKELIMATNAEFPPYEFHGKDDSGKDAILGIDAEIAQEIADSMGLTLRIEDMNFDSIIPSVTMDKADLGIAGMTVSEDRLQSVDFSNPYVEAGQAIIVKKDNNDVNGPDDLKGKKIGVQLGTTGDEYATAIEGNPEPERYNKGFEAVEALKQDKVDVVIIDNQPAKSFVKANEDSIKVLEEPCTSEQYAIAVKKGNTELLKAVNDALQEMKESGKLDEIMNKYISAE